MSYAGVGLATTRGSGTSGYVQRNAAYVKPRHFDTTTPTANTTTTVQATLQAAIKNSLNKSNAQLSLHDQKRQILLKATELKNELLRNQRVAAEDVESIVSQYRKTLLQQLTQPTAAALATDSTLAAADYQQLGTREERHAKQLKNERLAAALRINKNHEAGSVFKRMRDKKDAKAANETAPPTEVPPAPIAPPEPSTAPHAEQFLAQLQHDQQLPVSQLPAAVADNSVKSKSAREHRRRRRYSSSRSRSPSRSRSRSPSIQVKKEPADGTGADPADRKAANGNSRRKPPERRPRRRRYSSSSSASDSHSSDSDQSSSDGEHRTSKRRRRYSSDDSSHPSDYGSDDERDRRDYERYKRQRQRRRSYSRSISRSRTPDRPTSEDSNDTRSDADVR